MPVAATKINQELVDWALANLSNIPEHEDREYYARKISGMLVIPPASSYLDMQVIKQKARDYYDLRLSDFGSIEEFIEERHRLVKGMLGGAKEKAYIEPPVYFNYGYNVSVGDYFFANFNCTFLDWSIIRIGNHVAMGPNCTLTTVNHPLDSEDRRNLGLYAFPIVIEDDVWIGANVTILSGVTIGKGSVIAAGSLVTRDIPAHVVAAGSPAGVRSKAEDPKPASEGVQGAPI